MQLFLQIQELHKKQEAKKMMLIKKQEDESSNLLTDQHRQQKLLVSQHKLEQEIQALEAIIESKKLEANESVQGSTNIHDLENSLRELKEEKELLEDTNQKLTYKERELNDEVQNATKAAVTILAKKGDTQSIGIKRMGELDLEPWKIVSKQKFKNHPDDWQIPYATLTSAWEKNVRDGQWHPFKTVQVGDDKYEQLINKEDEKLAKLRREFGDAVYLTVVNALNELQEHNASGRYPVSVAWNYKQQRKATLEEIINHLAIEKVATKRRRRT